MANPQQDPWGVVKSTPLSPTDDPWGVVSKDGKPVGIPAPPKRTLLSRGMDWLYNKVIVPLPTADGKPAPPVQHNWEVDRKVIADLPEQAAMLATMGEGPAAVKLARPVIGAIRAGVGSLSGSAVKEVGNAMNGDNRSWSDIGMDAAVHAGANAGLQYGVERFLTGALRPSPGTPAAARAAAFNTEFPNPDTAPKISVPTILGKTGGMASRTAGMFEKIASLFTTGGAIANSADTGAQNAIGGKIAAITEPLPLPPPQQVGRNVGGAIKTAEAEAMGTAQSSIEAQRKAVLSDIKAREDNINQQLWNPGGHAPAPTAESSLIHDAPVASAKPSPFVKTQKVADEFRTFFDAERERRLGALGNPTRETVLTPEFRKALDPLLQKHPEYLVKSISRNDVSVLDEVMNVTKNKPEIRKQFTDAYLDTHIFKNEAGVADPAGLPTRLQEAYTSGALDRVLPGGGGKRMVERMSTLADILKNVQSPTQSYAQKLRIGQGAAELAVGAFAGTKWGPMVAAKLAAVEAGAAVFVSAMRAPLTRRILMDGLLDANNARSAATIIRALQLANSMKPSASHTPTIPEPPK